MTMTENAQPQRPHRINRRILVHGPARAGKTSTVLSLLNQLDDMPPVAYVFVSDDDAAKRYAGYGIPENLITTDCSSENITTILKSLYETQRRLANKASDEYADKYDGIAVPPVTFNEFIHSSECSVGDPRVTVILDDALHDTLGPLTWLENLVYNSDQCCITSIVTCQYLRRIAPSVRANIDYMYLLCPTDPGFTDIVSAYVEESTIEPPNERFSSLVRDQTVHPEQYHTFIPTWPIPAFKISTVNRLKSHA